MSWAWDETKFGKPTWVDLSIAVGNWSNASGLEPLDVLEWAAPAAASMRSFPAQFVAAVLSLGTNVGRPSAALPTDAATADECYIFWEERAARNLSDAHLLSSCVLKSSFTSSKEQAAVYSARSVSELIQDTGFDDYYCADLLDGEVFYPYDEAVYLASLVQALPATGSCAGGCPLSRPLCSGTLCVRPTCADVKPLCNTNAGAGPLARVLCGATCGCGNHARDLLWIGANSGCTLSCRKAAGAKAESATCSDVQPGSAELAALVGYSRAFERHITGWSATNASVRAELGCFALNFDYSSDDYTTSICNQEYFNTTFGAKSLVPFCPVSCGCIDAPSKPGCPRACRAPEPPTLRDLSDAQLALANAAMATWNGFDAPPYPPSCFGLNATGCNVLLTAWHRHPCPMACGIDPGAASTSSFALLLSTPTCK